MYKVDLHTHSVISPDGGITAHQYQQAIDRGLLDCIAVTDHNRIDFAVQLQQSLGQHIIVGEEILTTAGEIVGLYLTSVIPGGLTPSETIKRIKQQDGLVYIPHPFETVRKGLHPGVLEDIHEDVDIIEVYNGRAFAQNRSAQAVVWSKFNHIPAAASSDSHGYKGLGTTYTRLAHMPSRTTLAELIDQGTPIVSRPPVRSLLYPKYHRLRKKMRGDR
jgi:predicted metal-dependent phosphoesterase TrpH